MAKHSTTTITWITKDKFLSFKLPDDTMMHEERALIELYIKKVYPDEVIDWNDVTIHKYYHA